MSDRPIDANLTSSTATRVNHVPSAEEVAEYKARLIGVYDRGITIDRLSVDLPDHLTGEWCSKDDVAVQRMEVMGYQLDTEYSPKRSLNDGGDGTGRVGDVVFMTIPKWKKEVMDELRYKRYRKDHLENPTRQKEEKDFINNNQALGMPMESGKGSLIASKSESVNGAQINESLTKG